MNKDQKKIEENTKAAHKDFLMEYAPYVIIIIFIVIIRTFIATPVRVNGSSMTPTLKNNDMMILYKLTKRTRGIRRFDIVVINTESGKLIKRVIGLPGDKIRYEVIKNKNDEMVGTLYVNNEKIEEKFLSEEAKADTCYEDWPICAETIQVPDNEYYVMGDNRGDSKDSRMIGTIKYDDILGTTKLIFFPFNRMGNVN